MPTTDITVRRLEADEFDVLRRVRLAALADAPEMFQQTLAQAAATSDDEWRVHARRDAEGLSSICFVACRETEPVGMVWGLLDRDHLSIARVAGMWVAPDVRRAATGARLLRGVRDWAVGRGCAELRLKVFHGGSGAQSFYRTQGLRPLSPDPDAEGFYEYGVTLDVG